MNEAIRIGQEFVNQTEAPTEAETQKHMDELKPSINNLLHTFLPEDLTLKEVEIIAMTFNEIIWHPKEFLQAARQQPKEQNQKQK